MATTYKVLGQAKPAAAATADLYTVPAGKSAVVSTLTACNQAATTDTVRIAVRPSGAALALQHYLSYDVTVPANDALTLTLGLTLAGTDIVTVRSAGGNVSFGLFGSEVS